MARERKSHTGTWLAAAAATGMILAVAGSGHGHHPGLTGVPDSLHAATVSSGSTGDNEALANHLAARLYGWTGTQRGCLDRLWQRESGFDQYNTYPSHDTPPSTPPGDITTAYGIPQALPAQKMAAAGPDWQTNPATQIRWGLRYVKRTYKNPCAALSFEIANAGY